MRTVFTLLHRWAGLTIAAFLCVSGITGAVISWDHELDELLNQHLIKSESEGPRRSAFELARQVEERDPHARVTFLPLNPEPGYSSAIGVEGRVDPATGLQHELGYNQVFVDPVSGVEQGRREWGTVWPITRETVVSFLYVLHYSLHVPEMWGVDRWGLWLLGAIALIWTLDCFVGFYLTLPMRRAARAGRAPSIERQLGRGFFARWKPAWQIKTTGSAYRINFDLHRAFGLWFWLLLFILAFTAFSLNLYREVFYPLMSTVSQVTPSPFDLRAEQDRHNPIEPKMTFSEILPRAEAEAQRRGWREPAGAISYSSGFGIYAVQFFHPGDDHGAAGVGPAALYYDGLDGRLLGDRQPWKGTAADIFVQAQFPLHSGRILGLPGRILVSFMGLAVAGLSVTGVVIWYRKRRARLMRSGKATPVVTGSRPLPDAAE
jgi:uncharacterized iron-regulated membrane protein